MVDLKEILKELEQVNLAPILIPTLRVADPILGSLPKGSLQSILSEQETRNSMIKTVEQMAPLVPSLINLLGTVAASFLSTAVITVVATVFTPILKLTAPFLSKLVLKAIAPSLKLTRKIVPVLPPVIKGLNIFWTAEVFIEKGVRRIFTPIAGS